MLHTSSPFTTQSLELGPRLNLGAPSFSVRDHTEQPQHLNDLMGEKGLVLGFIGDIWHEASVRRMLWLQRHAHQLLRTGCNMALLICDQPHMLYGFYVSSAT